MSEIDAGGAGEQGPSFEEVLAERCPKTRPMRGVPPMFTINGCGLSLYGARDHEPVTGTYVKTLYLTLVFVPVLALSAYRVAKAPSGGWFFVGKEPLGPIAKTLTTVVLAAALTGGLVAGYQSYTNSPEYRAAQSLAEGHRLEGEGKTAKAARVFAKLASTPKRAEGRAALLALLDAAKGLPQTAELVGVAVRSGHKGILDRARIDRLASAANEGRETDPRGALALLDALAPVAPDEVAATREPVLAAILAQDPKAPKIATELALIYEQREELDRCESVLRPCAEALGEHEGARILGQLLTRKGEVDEAHRLLEPYVTKRLARLHQAEARLDQARESAWKSGIAALEAGKAGRAWYGAYEGAGEEQQGRMVQEWIAKRARNDPHLQQLEKALADAAAVVPVALDLGIVKLQRAQGMSDAETRHEELERAEKVFLAVRGVASDSAAYKLHLGTVYYWLGKEQEGHTLFEELLEGTKRAPAVLLRVAHELRGVGATGEARSLCEEAYAAAKEDEVKLEAASLRAVLATDAEDKVLWFERASTGNLFTQAQLLASKGDLALSKGEEAKAQEHLRAAIQTYAKLAQDQSALNNAALVYQRLYGINGDRRDFVKSVEMLERAERLDSSDPIVVANVAAGLLARASLGVIGERLRLSTLRSGPSLDKLGHLYRTAKEREAVSRALTASKDFKQAVERFRKLLVLSPKNGYAYSELSSAYSHSDSLEEHRALEAALRATELDHSAYAQSMAAWLAGGDPAKDREGHRLGLKRAAEVLAAARKRGDERTLSAALSSHVWQQLGGYALGLELDLSAIVALAEEAHRVHASHVATNVLVCALLTRTTSRLGEVSKTFADLQERTRRSLSAWDLPVVALFHEDAALSAAAAKDPDLRRAAKLVAELGRADPRSLWGWEWALLRDTLPEAARAAAKTIRADPVMPIRLRVQTILQPLDAESALNLAWYYRALGKDQEAEEALNAARRRGARLP